ncbi:MAG TPA: low specificity L-threonine aldolase [Roseimicrobium sp.]|nr:low specificity L-threonine aldolase [Roseimicrobium sp.]
MTSTTNLRPRQFASDNYAGICPEAWAALAESNQGHAPAYGNDPWTLKASDLIRDIFETDCEVFFAFSGTAANSLSLASTCQSYHSILCHETAHIETHECGAPEFFSNGTKVLTIAGEDGKISPASIEHMVTRRRDIHYPKPRAISITQSTEMGTVYSVEELKAIWGVAKKYDLKIQMDGARFANAVASLGAKPKEITWQAGVEVLCFGGTKNGTHVGDAVVFFNKQMAHEFDYRCKQAGQLCSKMRFMSAPWVGMLQNDVWLKYGAHANRMAALLRKGLEEIAGPKLLTPTQANMVFVDLTKPVIQGLFDKGWQFYPTIGETGCRFVCSWDTAESDVRDILTDIRTLYAVKG